MAYGRELQTSEMQGGQELLPCIPDQTMIQNIPPKMTRAASFQRAIRGWKLRCCLSPTTISTGMANERESRTSAMKGGQELTPSTRMADRREFQTSAMKGGQEMPTSTMRTDGREFRTNAMEGGQELLPCIPNHVTIQNIAPKMRWETLNVMQMVSREWRYVVRSRTAYDARVLSKSTEAFLVMVSFEQWKELKFTLYSCKYGTCLQLPAIPMAADIIANLECICFDGKLYLWVPVPENNSNQSCESWVEIWTLDLAGERRWTMCGRGNVNGDKFGKFSFPFENDVLDGRLYRFRGRSRPSHLNVLEPHRIDIRRRKEEERIRSTTSLKVKTLPQTEVYDPLSNIFSIITPKPLPYDIFGAASDADRKKQLVFFYEWEREQVRTSSSAIGGYYEAFYSEWRAGLSTILVDENDCCPRNAMAPQVYHSTLLGSEKLFFIQEKLVKLVDPRVQETREFAVIMEILADPGFEHVEYTQGRHGGSLDLQVYNTQKGTWEHWQSFPYAHGGGDESNNCATFHHGAFIRSCVFTDNVIWILVKACSIPSFKDSAKFALLKSLPFLGKRTDVSHSAAWIDVHFLTDCHVLRPIYL